MTLFGKIEMEPKNNDLQSLFYELLLDIKFAKHLIGVFFNDNVRRYYFLNDTERRAVNDAYDYMMLYKALGLEIVGGDNENTKIVAQALATNHRIVLNYIDQTIFKEIVEKIEAK